MGLYTALAGVVAGMLLIWISCAVERRRMKSWTLSIIPTMPFTLLGAIVTLLSIARIIAEYRY